jgi:hypothetical protein
MNKSKRIWILGAEDQELETIRKFLEGTCTSDTSAYNVGDVVTIGDDYVIHPDNSRGRSGVVQSVGPKGVIKLMDAEPYILARKIDGQRVRASEAYSEVSEIAIPDGIDTVVFVECNARISVNRPVKIINVDHHFKGDPGYGQPPAKFWSASSIGQAWMIVKGDIEPPTFMKYVAASDHCLYAAYNGQCPGVNPRRLENNRDSTKARRFGVDLEVVKERTIITEKVLDELLKQYPVVLNGERILDVRSGFTVCKTCNAVKVNGIFIGTDKECKHQDTKWSATLFNLVEVSARRNIPIMINLSERGTDKWKVILANASAPTIKSFISWASDEQLIGVYSDARRGYAGAYYPIEWNSKSSARKIGGCTRG